MVLTRGGATHECDDVKELADVVAMGLKWIDKGFDLEKVDSETAEFRLEICRGCDDLIPENNRCAHCCCSMDFKVTLKYNPIQRDIMLKKKLVACPIGKW